jgi:hypothetical protein
MVQFRVDKRFSLEEMGFRDFVLYDLFSSEEGIYVLLLCLVILCFR